MEEDLAAKNAELKSELAATSRRLEVTSKALVLATGSKTCKNDILHAMMEVWGCEMRALEAKMAAAKAKFEPPELTARAFEVIHRWVVYMAVAACGVLTLSLFLLQRFTQEDAVALS